MKRILRNLFHRFQDYQHFKGEQVVRSRLSDISKLPFFHSILFGATGHHCEAWRSVGNVFHSDAPIAIIVKRKGKVAGAVGFEVLGRTLLVRQLQGAPKANFHDGTRAEAFLLSCAEMIAETLQFRTIRVLTPETAIEYRDAAPVDDRPSELAKSHMWRIYSYPAEIGYGMRFCWRLRRKTYYRSIAECRAARDTSAAQKVDVTA
ncbi:MAG: hypothetical protein JNK19_05425 [Tabrizicola sp.]|nr:hypothetical protein [Tabrizicola sp.]